MSEEIFGEDEIIVLTDEDGKEERFIILCIIEYNGAQYYALLHEKQDDEDEFNEVAAELDDYLNSEIDYDEGEDE